MSDLISMTNGGSYTPNTTAHYLRRVLTGDATQVRSRLIPVLERIGYIVIDEEPVIQARCEARGWATWGGSADVIDYARTLFIRLKPLSDATTQATFDYVIKHPLLSKGEKEVLTREAESIVALCTVRAASMCAACGAEATDDSRFCRRCGAPVFADDGTLEVFRMTAETRAAHTSVATGTILLLIVNLLMLLTTFIVWYDISKGARVLLLVAQLAGWFGSYALPFAWRRINRALTTGRATGITPSPDLIATDMKHYASPSIESAAAQHQLPSPAERFSVIEGTTELLAAPSRVRSSHADAHRDTGEMN